MYESGGENKMLSKEKKTEAKSTNGLTLSLCKAFDILNCFTAETPKLRITDITKKVQMTQSNVSRLINTMVAYGYVEKDEDSGYYQLSKRIISLSSVALNNSELRKQALPELFNLEQKYEVGANLAIFDQNKMYYLAHVDSRRSPRMYTMVGYTSPLHCTAIGKILLANKSDEEIKSIIDQTGMQSFTYNTITSFDVLMEQITNIRRVGYSTEYGEHSLGGACVAAAIRDRTGNVIAGLSVSGKFMNSSIQENEEEVAKIVINSALLISNKMGYL